MSGKLLVCVTIISEAEGEQVPKSTVVRAREHFIRLVCEVKIIYIRPENPGRIENGISEVKSYLVSIKDASLFVSTLKSKFLFNPV